MATQLPLIEQAPDWRLDEDTRAVGRRGVAAVRAALQAARRASAPTADQQQHRPAA